MNFNRGRFWLQVTAVNSVGESEPLGARLLAHAGAAMTDRRYRVLVWGGSVVWVSVIWLGLWVIFRMKVLANVRYARESGGLF